MSSKRTSGQPIEYALCRSFRKLLTIARILEYMSTS